VVDGLKAFERPWQAVMLALEGKKKEGAGRNPLRVGSVV
jgi:hypothetical protein